MLKRFIKNLWPACRTVFAIVGGALGSVALFFGVILFIAWAKFWAVVPLPFIAVGIIAYSRAKEEYNIEKRSLESRIDASCETYRSAGIRKCHDEARKAFKRARAYIDEYEEKYGRDDGVVKQYSSHLEIMKQMFREEE